MLSSAFRYRFRKAEAKASPSMFFFFPMKSPPTFPYPGRKKIGEVFSSVSFFLNNHRIKKSEFFIQFAFIPRGVWPIITP